MKKQCVLGACLLALSIQSAKSADTLKKEQGLKIECTSTVTSIVTVREVCEGGMVVTTNYSQTSSATAATCAAATVFAHTVSTIIAQNAAIQHISNCP